MVTGTRSRRNGRAGPRHDPAPSSGVISASDRTAHEERRVERRIGLPSGRAVVGGLLMALAAVGTFLAYAGATADDTVEVLVAHRDLRPGEVIARDDVSRVSVEVPDTVRGLFGSASAAVGRRVVAPVDAGEFLLGSATVAPSDGGETLELSVSLPSSRAVGRLRPGERVDVLATWSGNVTELIAVDARVLEVSGGSSSVLGGGETTVVRLGLRDFAQVEALVHAQAAGDITMVRAAIGTERHDLGRQYRPSTRPSQSARDTDGR